MKRMMMMFWQAALSVARRHAISDPLDIIYYSSAFAVSSLFVEPSLRHEIGEIRQQTSTVTFLLLSSSLLLVTQFQGTEEA